jgi:hypothetical protein
MKLLNKNKTKKLWNRKFKNWSSSAHTRVFHKAITIIQSKKVKIKFFNFKKITKKQKIRLKVFLPARKVG